MKFWKMCERCESEATRFLENAYALASLPSSCFCSHGQWVALEMCRNWAAVTSKLRCMAGNTALPCQHVQACVAKTFQARGISYTGVLHALRLIEYFALPLCKDIDMVDLVLHCGPFCITLLRWIWCDEHWWRGVGQYDGSLGISQGCDADNILDFCMI